MTFEEIYHEAAMGTCDPVDVEEAWKAEREKLIAEVERQAGEIGRLEVDRDLAQYDKEKAEAELAELKEASRDIMTPVRKADELRAENQRLQERVRELAEIALNWIVSAQQARGSIFGPRDEVDYESAKQRVFALQHKEGE